MQEALDAVLDRARAKTGSLMLLDERLEALRIVAARGFPNETVENVKKFFLRPGQGVAGHVYVTGRPYYLRHPQDDSLFVKPPIPTGPNFQFLSLPLQDGAGKTVGVLNIHFPTETLMGAPELEDLARLANRVVGKYLRPN